MPSPLNTLNPISSLKGTHTRRDMQEFAQLYSLSGDYTKAASILQAIQNKGYTVAVAKEIAREQVLSGGSFRGHH